MLPDRCTAIIRLVATVLPTDNARLVGRSVFSRVLVGVDGTAEALEAARQAALLRSTQAGLALLSAWHLAPPPLAGFAVPAYSPSDESRESAQQALDMTVETLGLDSIHTTVAQGVAWKMLIAEAERRHETLVAVGPHDGGRMSGIVAGSTATELLHRSPCSVLIARAGSTSFPGTIVVGVDGSPESAVALAAAQYLADRFDTELRTVSADGTTSPVRALAAAASTDDLVVVGSRGLQGVKALGSVSERVAHAARCSVLVVRYRT